MRISAIAIVLAFSMSSAALPAVEEVTVTVRVRTTEGRAIPQSYVALVPIWRPSSRPLIEEIAAKGSSVFRVPAGTYQVIAGAKGFAISSTEPTKVTEKSGRSLDVELNPLVTARGTMMDNEGRPIVGGHVSSIHGAIPAPLGRLSELAVRHLAADWRAKPDEHGHWTLMVPEGTVPLLFEAPGAAAEWRIHSTIDNLPLHVSLSTGASLTVTTDRVDPNMIVTLSREDSDSQKRIFENEQARVWAEWSRTTELTWTSLPPGTYAIYAKYPAPYYFMQSAVKLATVILEPEDHGTMKVTLPAAREPASSASLFLRGASRSDLGEELQAFGRDAAGTPQRLEQFIEDVIGGSVVHLRTDGIRPPLYMTTWDRFFSTVPDLAESSQGANQEPWPVVVHQRVDAHFLLRSADEELLPPQAGLAVLRDCRSASRVMVPIQIRGSIGQFTAAAGCQGMVLELEPFEPVITGQMLAPGEQSLGEFVLRAAGSVDVRVVRDPSGAVVPGATVRAFNGEVPAGSSMVVKEALTDDRGWARLSGLPSYWKLRVTAQTAEGDTSEAAIVRVQPREQALIDPLEVPDAAVMIVDAKIDEAFLTRFPATRVVTLLVRPADPDRESEKRQENTAKENSATRFERLHPGRWLVSGIVSVAGTYSLFDIEDVQLKAGEERRVEATIEPNVFEGIVTSEGRGVAAKVIVKDRDRLLYFNTDTSGLFNAALDDKGTYKVSVARLSAQGNVIPIGDVSFIDPARRIEIAIPSGGSVTARVRRDDRPVPNAVVWLSRREPSGHVEQITNRGGTTNAGGETVFSDLIPGEWTFSVRETGQRKGAEETVTVEQGQTIVVELELTSAAAIEGRIRDLGGSPVPRARVECLFTGPSGLPESASTDTDAEGGFVIELVPPTPSFALCSMIGPMGTVDAFRSVPGHQANLSVSGATGRLHISDWVEYRNPDNTWLVAQDGRVISLSAVAVKIGQFGTALSIPALAAGSWKVVRIDSLRDWVALAGGLGMSLPTVAEVTLRSGGFETIHLNDTAPDRQGSGQYR